MKAVKLLNYLTHITRKLEKKNSQLNKKSKERERERERKHGPLTHSHYVSVSHLLKHIFSPFDLF
jgi:hypothetical protein